MIAEWCCTLAPGLGIRLLLLVRAGQGRRAFQSLQPAGTGDRPTYRKHAQPIHGNAAADALAQVPSPDSSPSPAFFPVRLQVSAGLAAACQGCDLLVLEVGHALETLVPRRPCIIVYIHPDTIDLPIT